MGNKQCQRIEIGNFYLPFVHNQIHSSAKVNINDCMVWYANQGGEEIFPNFYMPNLSFLRKWKNRIDNNQCFVQACWYIERGKRSRSGVLLNFQSNSTWLTLSVVIIIWGASSWLIESKVTPQHQNIRSHCHQSELLAVGEGNEVLGIL